MKKVVRFLLVVIVGTAAAAAALSGFFMLLGPLILFYCLYRSAWMFSKKGRLLRSQRKFKRREEKLLNREQHQRKTFSVAVDRTNIDQLLVQINNEIKARKIHIDPVLLRDTRYFLSRCQNDLDFEKAIQVHNTLLATHVSQLNTRLGELLDEICVYR